MYGERLVEPMSVSLWVDSETGPLESVVIGYPDTFVWPEPINKKQRKFIDDPPTRPVLRTEFDGLISTLESRGIEVTQPLPVAGVPDQLTPRDIGFVVRDIFVIASMAPATRRDEWIGLAPILERIPPDKIVRVPEDVFVEGGDVIFDRGILYVGLSERSTHDGAAFLAEIFGGIAEVVPVELNSFDGDEDILHLDCAFVPVGKHHALIYADGMRSVPDAIHDQYEWIDVAREDQLELAANVLSISPTTVISRLASARVNASLRDAGLEVIELPFTGTPKSGGSFRCASLPLARAARDGTSNGMGKTKAADAREKA